MIIESHADIKSYLIFTIISILQKKYWSGQNMGIWCLASTICLTCFSFFLSDFNNWHSFLYFAVTLFATALFVLDESFNVSGPDPEWREKFWFLFSHFFVVPQKV